jgi:hypothetical protein
MSEERVVGRIKPDDYVPVSSHRERLGTDR